MGVNQTDLGLGGATGGGGGGLAGAFDAVSKGAQGQERAAGKWDALADKLSGVVTELGNVTKDLGRTHPKG